QMQCAQHATVLKGTYTPRQVLALIGKFEFSVGMRLHFLIFSALQHVPFVALPYASKVTDLLQDLDMEMPPLANVNTGRLLATIDRSWDWRDKTRARIQHCLPALQQRALETNRLLVDLLANQTARARHSTA
ncbi:MAG: polysaccharide pyruvyl transferase family protein, partial [Pseudomonadota bacterium]|nr:polysaccharide pyruvyl transferase family protein [Pseudomonadota bacterium]